MSPKEYTFIYPPKVYSTYRNVVYVESRRNERINAFIRNNYYTVKSIFSGYGLKFHYLPVDIEQNYFVADMIVSRGGQVAIDVPDIVKESNYELLRYLSDECEADNVEPSLFFCDKKFHGKKPKNVVLKALPFDDVDDLMSQISDMAMNICRLIQNSSKATGDGNGNCGPMSPYEDVKDDLAKIIISGLNKGMPEDEILNTVKRIVRRHSKRSGIVVLKDYRIVLEEFGGKELKLADLPKSLYLFYLKHPDGIESEHLSEYMPEIAYIYLKIRTGRHVSHPLETIKRMIAGNQRSNNLRAIRDAFQKAYDLERNSVYTIEPDKKHPHLLMINVPESQRLWHCPDILNKKIPTLAPHVKDIIEATWHVLHALHENKIDEAIGLEPPKERKHREREH